MNRTSKALFRGAVAWTLALLALVTVHAQIGDTRDFLVDAWTTENGLPQNSILGIEQTDDGYLWVATFNGLARFDGVRFTVFDPINTPALGSARVTSIERSEDGGLWIMTEEGFVSRFHNGEFERMNGRLGLPDLPLIAKGADPKGNVFLSVSGRDERYRFQNGKFVPTQFRNSLQPDEIAATRSHSRSIWLGQKDEWARVTDWTLQHDLLARGVPEALVYGPATDGDIWMAYTNELRKLRSGEARKLPPGENLSELTFVLEDRESNVWIANWGEGVRLVTPTGEVKHLPLIGGTAALTVRFVFFDREGNAWIGTDVAGLQRIKPRSFRTFARAEGMTGEVIRTVTTGADRRLWIVTQSGVEWLDPAGKFHFLKVEGYNAWAGVEAANGDFWIGDFGGALARIRSEQLYPAGKALDGIRVITARAAGGVWMGGLTGFGHGVGEQFFTDEIPDRFGKPQVRSIIEEPSGKLWLGAYGAGLFSREGTNWNRFGRDAGLNDEQIISLYRGTNGTLWVGTTFGGLNRFKDGHFSNYSKAGASMPSRVSGIIEDDLGFLWLSTLNGIHRVALKELDAFAEGERSDIFVRRFDRSDGLLSGECSETRQPTACKTTDGRLWFATINGLAMIDPSHLPANPLPPTVAIEEILVDGKPISARAKHEANPISLGPGSSHLEIHYTAVTLQSGENARFKYRLQGSENEWQDAGSRRVAYFNKLPPGDYTFQVTAANNAGLWNQRGQSLALVVAPLLYQTWWFKSALGLCAAALVLTAFKMRIATLNRERFLQEEFSRRLIDSQEQERSRIARELHDGLGQDLLVIKNYAMLGVSANTKETAAGHHTTISETATEAIRQVREISQNLRPYQLEHLGATSAIRSIYKRLAEGSVAFEALIENIDPLFSKDDASHLFRILQELTNNVLKHSRATDASVIVERAGDQVGIEVTDNGRGFDGHASVSGIGLRGIAERVRILGGTVNIGARDGGGTRVHILLPIRKK